MGFNGKIKGVYNGTSTSTASGIFSVNEAMLANKQTAWPVTITLILRGISIADGTESLSYPAGTTAGDLAIAVTHNFSSSLPYAPSGYTTAFTTSADPYNYAKSVSYRVIQAGDTSVAVNNSSGGANFDGTLIVLKGRTAVSSSYAWSNNGSGQSTSLSVPVSGTLIAVATDRGATGYPTIVGTYDQTTTRAITFFWQKTSVLLSYTSGTSVTFTDFSDTYNTNMLMIVAT